MVAASRARAGRSSLGCLVTLLLIVAAGYFAVNVGEVYLRYYRFHDSMEQNARFAAHFDDAAIRNNLKLAADTLDLPAAARRVQIYRRDRHITISVASRESSGLIAVRDTGIGVAPEQLEAIFEPFVQAGSALQSRDNGVGLGLVKVG